MTPDKLQGQPAAETTQNGTTSAGDAHVLEQAMKLLEDKVSKARGEILMTQDGIDFGNFDGLWRWANLVIRARMAPKGIDTPEAVCLIAIKGRNLGIEPFTALWNTAVINGRPTIWGDLPLTVCRRHKDWDESGFDEYWEVDGKRVDGEPPPEAFKKETTVCVVKSLRKGASKQKESRFSMAHAKQAGLTSKAGDLYSFYPQRMLKFRARGYNLRDNFGDALNGIGIQELNDDEPSQQAPPTPPVGRVNLFKDLGDGTGESITKTQEEKPQQQAPVVTVDPVATTQVDDGGDEYEKFMAAGKQDKQDAPKQDTRQENGTELADPAPAQTKSPAQPANTAPAVSKPAPTGASCHEWKTGRIPFFYNKCGPVEIQRVATELNLGDINKLCGTEILQLAKALVEYDKAGKLNPKPVTAK